MGRERILIVEDEVNIVELHKYNLEKDGYKVFVSTTGEEALAAANKEAPDLVLLDLMLPGMDGLEVCRRIRQEKKFSEVAIIMVTAKNEDADIITGLEIGADDYVTKPFSPKVLVARIRNVLRRKERSRTAGAMNVIKIHDIRIDTERYEVLVEKKPVNLSATEFAILKLLASNAGIVLSRSRIINSIKGDDYPVTERSVDVQILGLRKKLGKQGKFIETVRGIGYRLKDEQL